MPRCIPTRKPCIISCLLILLACLSACSSVRSTPTATASQVGSLPTQTSTPVSLPSPVVTVTVQPSATPIRNTPTPPSTPTITFTPTITGTPDPYAAYTIDTLMQRTYGGGEISQGVVIDANSHFTRTMINYPSDGLNIAGFMNVPNPQHMADLGISPPYPVVIALHGYIDPAIYNTVDYTTRYADDLARAGFIVLHPNLRGYRPSDDGDNLFRVGMATDVLNLVALVQETAGKPGALSQADPASIGLWGHSMGGGITTRVITVDPAVKAAVLYGAMSPDDQKNYDRIYRYFSSGTRGLEELQAPDEAFTRISPLGYLDQIQAAVAIHHGEQDADVPLAWSLDTCRRLQELEKQVACYTYPDQPHTFLGQGDALFTSRVIDFFNQTLR